ncbi:C40 family peptidase [Flaviflexus equikiangi]|uniref:C40 family peptidase n=1 Tax=Flaviflexus equikiangi TaxID=2758573 RepID=A0ABS2TCT2_9ACTO|nr:C40 family peptidase [Flaviflexus equikiangi]MBM9432455.1 C40 family peptidase [Flaviflexus equikiangi]
MIKSQRSGRHVAAPAVKPMTAGVVTAAAATTGMIFSATVPAALAAEEEVGASEQIDLAQEPVEELATEFTVQTDGAQDFALDSVTVSAQAPVVAEPVVEEVAAAPEVIAAPEVAAVPAQTTTQAPAQVETVEETVQAPAAPVASGRGAQVVAIARSYVGAPYVWGGTSPAGWDCIGFAGYVYRQVGVSLPASSSAARYAGTQVSAAEAQPGDLMWWPGHVGIYTGNGMHIAAWNPSMGTKEAAVWGSPIYLRVL